VPENPRLICAPGRRPVHSAAPRASDGGLAGKVERQLGQILVEIAIVALPLLVAVVLHEVAHGAVAYVLGDPTAAERGRLTLNPLPHVDPIGTLLLPGLLMVAPLLFGTPPFVFGYARPVPVDFRRLRHPRRDTVLVALAGPATNLLLAAASAFALVWLARGLADGSWLVVPALMAQAALGLNCLLAVFNLLPVPPLDGGRVLTALLPVGLGRALVRLEGVGLMVVLLVAFNTGLVPALVRPVQAFFLGLAQ
jgi:Zn-dependent protease